MESQLVVYLAFIVAVIVLAAAAVAYLIRLRGRAEGSDEGSSLQDRTSERSEALSQSVSGELNSPVIRFEESMPLTTSEEARLVKVTDQVLIERIDSAIPILVQSTTNAASITNLNKAIHAHNSTVEAGGTLYRAILPKGAQLSQSRDMEGAVRGIFHGRDGIAGHANLVAVDAKVDPSMTEALNAVNAVGTAMNVASMVVGQYYMAQISDQLEGVTKSIDKISSFQDTEYRSRVYALVAAVQKCAKFQTEVLENEELRLRSLSSLDDSERECAQLLGQANLKLEDYSKKRGLSFDEYEVVIYEADRWFQHQQVLLKIMEEIARLTHVLNCGGVSIEYCWCIYQPYAAQAESALDSLRAWHGDQMSRLEFDETKRRRRRQGIGGALMGLPGVFNDDLNYSPISKRTASIINRHLSSGHSVDAVKEVDLYQEEVTLIERDGEVYYLLPEEVQS